ncbi:MAG TPA: 30S ribosomal protein S4 [Candidatus Dojkabacteria bacterium]|nr:30S ribosomal protein S4 [Candidatus Dojkabacteria bacterium]
MGRYTGPKEKLSRREGVNLFLKGFRSSSDKAGIKRKPFAPGQHGNKRRVRQSNYGIQLREKQKVKRIYGMRERQFRNAYLESVRRAKNFNSDKGLELLRILEMRLDNVVYLAGLAVSRGQARQFVTHRHIKVNGEILNVPSYEVKVGDTISLADTELKPVEVYVKSQPWLIRDGVSASVMQSPTREMIDEGIKENLIVEYYSK